MITIDAAAICLGGTIHSLPRPARHGDIIRKMCAAGIDFEDVSIAEKGFLTSEGKFVCRSPALRIASEAGQVISTDSSSEHGLSSEDIW